MLNLFEPVVSSDRQHPYFRWLLQLRNAYVFDVLNDWLRGFVDRDNKFVKEFQTEFNSSFWELYIFAVLKRFRFDVDFSRSSPDFCVGNPPFNIEAVVASNAQNAIPEHFRHGLMPPDNLNAFNRTAIVRLANSFDGKRKKYLDYYRRLDAVVDRPFILAMTNFEQPFSFLAAHRAIDALLLGYYVDEDEFIQNGEVGELQGSNVNFVLKENGSPIKLGLFQDDSYKEISAVIYSSCASMGKVRALSSDPITPMMFEAFRWNPNSIHPHVIQLPKSRYEESLLDGLRIYHNPFADHPLDPQVFRHPHIAQTIMRSDGSWETDQREGMLLTRRVSTSIEAKLD